MTRILWFQSIIHNNRRSTVIWGRNGYSKPQPNYQNISAQHIPTLLAKLFIAPAKRQHITTSLGATCRVCLATLLRHVAACIVRYWKSNLCTCLGTTLLHKPDQMTTSCNIHKCCMKNLNIFKFESTTPNTSQHVTTRHNRVAKQAQHVAPRNAAISCIENGDTLHCNCGTLYQTSLERFKDTLLLKTTSVKTLNLTGLWVSGSILNQHLPLLMIIFLYILTWWQHCWIFMLNTS